MWSISSRSIGEPVHLLGHSYGAHCALLAAAHERAPVNRLVLYEPAWPAALKPDALAALETLAVAGAWDQFAYAFFANRAPRPERRTRCGSRLRAVPPIVADAPASLGDLRALARIASIRIASRDCDMPVLLQIGSESPREFYVTDALAAVLPCARVETLAGQAHEGMTTAPGLYAAATMRFLLADRLLGV